MGESNSIETIWRYLTFAKFVSLLELGALWLSRLGVLEDQFEGTLPDKTKEAMIAEHLKWTEAFPQPEQQEQLSAMADKNVQDGRDVLAVNCWFMGANESQQMWDEYAPPPDGIVIQSTLQRLNRAILNKHEFTTIGSVRYVDFSTHDLGIYHGHQAHQRALLKRLKYSHESEVRIVTMNLVCPGCLNSDGNPPTDLQLSGPGMFDPSRSGLYLRMDLDILIERVMMNPHTEPWFRDLVSRLCRRYGLKCPVERSALNR